MLKQLRRKFVAVLMLVVMLLMAVIFGLIYRFTRINLENESMQSLQQLAGTPGFQQSPRDEHNPNWRYFIMSTEPDGSIQITGTLSMDSYTQEELREIWNLATESQDQTGVLEQYELRYLAHSPPMGRRMVFLDISGQNMALESLRRVFVFVAVIMFGIMFGLSMLLARWMVRPVEQAWQQQRQFVADASHEMKTPLTVILTNAELLQVEGCSEQDRQRFSDSILTMSHQMRGLVEGLLELARVDNGTVKTNLAPMMLSELMEDGILIFEPLFFEQGLTLNANVEPGLRCKGSVPHLRQVLEILLDNALKYTASGGCVEVTLKRQNGHASLRVAGPGQTISAADLKNIFKRFYRVDKARSRDGSYGLGLSIAQGIVQEHGGRIWAESTDGINSFHVLLPLN